MSFGNSKEMAQQGVSPEELDRLMNQSYRYSTYDALPMTKWFDPTKTAYDPMGRGASPMGAVRMEALGNIFPFTFNRPPDNYPSVSSMMQNDIYPVRNEFVPDWSGSGQYNPSGTYANTIFLNPKMPFGTAPNDMNTVLRHEQIHKEMGNMGGITQQASPKLEKFIRKEPESWRWPQERVAYPESEHPTSSLLQTLKYFIPGDFRRELRGYE